MRNHLLALALLAAASCPGQTLDQSYAPATVTVSYGVDGTSWARGQTFTVGQTGVLAGIDLLVVTNSVASPVLWDIRSTISGLPTESNLSTLASGSIDGASLPAANTYYYFDLTAANLSVTSSDVLAITLRGTTGSTVASLRGRNDDGYAGGTAVQGVPGGAIITWSVISGVDFGIKTYMAIPEPATYAVLLGLGALGAVLIRRRQRAA